MMLGRSHGICGSVLLLLGAAVCAQAQFTVSARPGLLNYFEGDAYIDFKPVKLGQQPPIFLGVNNTLAMGAGKAEILLMPGVFLRVGDRSQVQMLKPSLYQTSVALLQGEAILEAIGLVRGSEVQIDCGGATITITTNGLYRIRAGPTPTAGVFDGALEVTRGTQTIKLRKGHETALSGHLQSEHMDMNQPDELYAWSNVRSQYEAAAAYESARTLEASNRTVTGGWYFNDLFDSWTWLSNGAYFSPFGWGYYSPVSVGGAVVVQCPVHRGGHWPHPHPPGGVTPHPGGHEWESPAASRFVPVNPAHPPALGVVASSAREEQAIRASHSNGSQFNWYSSQQLTANGHIRAGYTGSSHVTASSSSARAASSGFSRESAVHASGSFRGGSVAGSGGGYRGGGSAGGYHGGGGNSGGGFHGGGGYSGGGGGSHASSSSSSSSSASSSSSGGSSGGHH